jgi:hypothetical protein
VFVTPPGDGKDIEQVRRRLDRPVRVLEAAQLAPDASR